MSDGITPPLEFGRVEPVEIQVEMERSFLEYSMSVIMARALPDARDGLKPVHRRILYAMFESGVRPDRPTSSAPGWSATSSASTTPTPPRPSTTPWPAWPRTSASATPWSTATATSASPHDPPGAMRYTECRLAPLAMQLLAGIDEDTVDMVSNYDGKEEEPWVLPARFPNLLVNGSQGIAVGMATNIPPHNLGEVIDATIHLIDHPEATPDDLMAFVKGPDFPTGGLILGRAGIQDAYRTGPRFHQDAGRRPIEEGPRGTQIIATEIPYQASVESIAEKAAELVNARAIDGIREIRNERANRVNRLVFELKRDAVAQVVLNNLYKHTPLQSSFPVNMVALVDGVPRTLNLAQMLTAYVGHQVEVVTRRVAVPPAQGGRPGPHRRGPHPGPRHDRPDHRPHPGLGRQGGGAGRAHGRAVLVQRGPGRAHPRHDPVPAHPAGPVRPRGRDGQAAGDHRRAGGHPGRPRPPAAGHQGRAGRGAGQARRAPPGQDHLRPGRPRHPRPHRGRRPGRHHVASRLHQDGGGRRLPHPGPGRRGVAGAKLRDNDYVERIVHTTAHAYLLFFSNRGKVYRLKAHEIPMKERTARGTAIVNLLALAPNERIQAIIDTRDYETSRFLVFVTKKGQVKKTRFTEYDSSRRDGLIAINLRDDDELVRVIQTGGEDDIFMVARSGMTVRFSEEEVRASGRAAQGVIGMRLRDDDEVVSADAPRPDAPDLLVVTDAGYGKRTKLERFPRKGRGTMGVRGIRLTARRGYVVAAFMVGLDDDMFLISSGGTTIRMAVREISSQGRDATGVKIMNLDEGQSVAAVAPVFGGDD